MIKRARKAPTLFDNVNNNYGRSGIGVSGGVYPAPMFVEQANNVVVLSLNYDHTCALSENGSISCWGRNKHGQLGIGQSGDRNTPNLIDYNNAPFASITGAAPVGLWEDQSGLRGRIVTPFADNVWKLEATVSENADMSMYDLHITLLKLVVFGRMLSSKTLFKLLKKTLMEMAW